MKILIIPVTPIRQNAMLIWNEATRQGLVSDPGGDVEQILEAISKNGVTVEKILLTHGHFDHAGGAAELRDVLKVPVEGPHHADKFLLDSLAETARGFGMEGRALAPDRWLEDGEVVSAAGFDFEILHCPGHSPGSVVFFERKARFCIMGDVLFAGSVGRTDFPYGDTEALITSIKTKLLPLGDDVQFVPGHGRSGTFGQERKTNPFLTGQA